MTKRATAPTPLDPMIAAAVERLADLGPTWKTNERDQWCNTFEHIVRLAYPGKPPRAPRKTRTKPAE